MNDSTSAHRHTVSLRLAALALLVSGSSLARAQTSHALAPTPLATVPFQIPAQPLDNALAQLARASGLQLMAPPALLQDRQSSHVQGTFSPQAAVQQLLQGTGLAGRISGSTLIIANANTDTALQEVTVRSATHNLPEAYAGGQIARGGSLGLLGNSDVLDTPFSVVSFTSELLENQQTRTLADVMINDASVRSLTAAGGFGDSFQIRGFNVANAESFLNDFGGLTATTNIPTELIERVELLKGPGALARGMAPEGSIGGSINLVTKRAGDAPLTRLTTRYSSQSQIGTHLDVGRRFGQDKAWGVRFNGVLRNGEGSIDGGKQRIGLAALGLDYRSSQVRWSLDTFTYHDDSQEFRPQAMVRLGAGGYSADRLPTAPDSRLNFYPGSAKDAHTTTVLSRLEYDVTDHLTLLAGVGYARFRVNQDFPLGALQDTSGSMLVSNAVYDDARTTTAADVGLRASLRTGSVDHRIALSHNWLQRDSGYYYAALGSSNSSIYQPTPIQSGSHQPPVKDSRLQQQSMALTDTLALLNDRVQLTLGLRHQTIQTRSPAVQTRTSANSPLAGMVVKPTDQLSLYANYTAGLTDGGVAPLSAANANQVIAPYQSKQLEVGIKRDWGKLMTQLALFQIKKPTSYQNPDSGIYSYAGEQRNRGLEVSLYGEPQRGLRMMASAAFTQAQLTRIEDTAVQGQRAPNVPRHMLSMAVDWEVPGMPGLSLNGRALHVASVHLNNANTLRVPSWTRFDVGARYATKLAGQPVMLRATLENLTNRNYWLTQTVSSMYSYAMVSAPRTLTLSASIDF